MVPITNQIWQMANCKYSQVSKCYPSHVAGIRDPWNVNPVKLCQTLINFTVHVSFTLYFFDLWMSWRKLQGFNFSTCNQMHSKQSFNFLCDYLKSYENELFFKYFDKTYKYNFVFFCWISCSSVTNHHFFATLNKKEKIVQYSSTLAKLTHWGWEIIAYQVNNLWTKKD